LCIGLLSSLKLVEDQIRGEQITHHYDSFSIKDFDYSRESTLTGFLSHVILKVGGIIRAEQSPERRFDILASLRDRIYAIEVKRYVNSKNLGTTLSLFERLRNQTPYHMVLITNTIINEDMSQLIRSRGIILIDRKGLLRIIDNNETILDYLR